MDTYLNSMLIKKVLADSQERVVQSRRQRVTVVYLQTDQALQ